MEIQVTMDHASTDWRGHVGVVTKLIPRLDIDVGHSMALIWGPEIMMRFAASALHDIGLPDEAIHLSLERNMKCAVGLCGHCQFAGSFIYKDGAVMRYDKVRRLLVPQRVAALRNFRDVREFTQTVYARPEFPWCAAVGCNSDEARIGVIFRQPR
jgi:hypothetical protein